jgi:hypothetical protein
MGGIVEPFVPHYNTPMLVRCSPVILGALAAACSLAVYSSGHGGANPSDAGEDNNAPPIVDAATEDVGASTDSNVALSDCLGTPRPVFFCDGFEGVNPSSSWKPLRRPDARAELFVAFSPKLAGAQSLRAGFSTLPPGGDAKLEFKRPGGAGPLSLQVSIYITSDTDWTAGQAVPLFELRSFTAEAVAVGTFIANGGGPNGKIELRVPGSLSLDLGPANIGNWACYEIAYDGTYVTGFAGAANKGSVNGRAATDHVQIGMEWNYGENNGAGKHVYFDDVVIAPAPIGCLH